MADLLIVVAAMLTAIVIGLWLYSRFSQQGDTAIAAFGLIRNVSTFLIGVFLLMTGMWVGVILGAGLIILAVFLGSTHANNLDENTSLRKKLAG